MINGMIVDRSYQAVTGRKGEIINKAMGVDYSKYERDGIVFDYEALMNDTGYTLDDHIRIQQLCGTWSHHGQVLHNTLCHTKPPQLRGCRCH